MLFRIIKAKINFGRLRTVVGYRSIAFLFVTFVVLNLHVLTQNSTTMPPRSVAFGTNGQVEPTLKSRSPSEKPRSLAGYYTADPIGTSHTYPMDPIILDSLVHGEIPFWNPYSLTGIPLLADYWWGMFYPPNFLKLLIPEAWWDMYSAFHVLLLSLVVYFLARSAYSGARNATFAGSAVFGAGFILLYFPTHELISVSPWGAMLFLAIERLVKKRWDWLGLACAAGGVYGLGTAGHPTLAIFWAVAFLVYLLARWVLDRNTTKALVPFLTIATLAAFVAAPNVVPFVNYVLAPEGNSLKLFDQPHFFSLRDFFLIWFPNVFGPLHRPQPGFSEGLGHGHLLLVPFLLYPAFVGGWAAIKRRNVQITAMMVCALFMTLWGFGIPPVSELSLLPLMRRLSFNYIIIVPTVTLCILAGYGYHIISRGSLVQLRKITSVYSALYLAATFFLVVFVWRLGLLESFFGSSELLQRGFLPDVAFAIIGPLLVLFLATKVERRSGFRARAYFVSAALFLGLGLSVSAVYPNANALGGIAIPLAAFAMFVVASILLAALTTYRKSQAFEYATNPGSALLMVAGFVTVANVIYPGLPERYDIVRPPKFVDMLSQDRLNWRVYGLDGAVPMNNLARYKISAVNNLSVLTPKALNNFFFHYLDSHQPPNQFYGLSLSPDSSPMNEYLRNIRFWEYIGVRHIAVASSGFYPQNQESDLFAALGYERLGSGLTTLVNLPKSSSGDTPLGILQQMDCSDGEFSVLRIKLGTYGKSNSGKIVLTVTDSSNGTVLARASLNASQLRDALYQPFSLGRSVCTHSADKVDVRVYHEDSNPDSMVAAWRTGSRNVDVLRIFNQTTSSTGSRFRLVGMDDETGISVIEDTQASPRAYFTKRFSVAKDGPSALVAFAKQDDLRAVAFGEDANSICQSYPIGEVYQNESETDVKITELRSSDVAIAAKIPSAGTLVLVDTFMPGWTAVVDGKAKPVLRINGLFRGVCLDSPGMHNVVMHYRPPYWTFALFLSAIGIIGIAIILFRVRYRYRETAR